MNSQDQRTAPLGVGYTAVACSCRHHGPFFFYCAEAYAAWTQKLTQARINDLEMGIKDEFRRRRLCG